MMLVRIIAVTVFLRSFIAPGFMLGASPHGGFSIIFCNGPAGVQLIHNDHHRHAHHHGGNHDSGEQSHVTPACAQWSTSGSFALAAPGAPQFPAPAADEERPWYRLAAVPPASGATSFIRGPPVPA